MNLGKLSQVIDQVFQLAKYHTIIHGYIYLTKHLSNVNIKVQVKCLEYMA